jgi:F-type H+-transporting ATPase subunit gamma
MSGLKQLRSRIKSVKSTQKITKAMQIVSATKFTKAKNQIKDSEDYIEILRDIMANVASRTNLQDMAEEEKKFFSEGLCSSDLNESHLLIVVTSERGLCGSFNFSVSKQVKFDIANLENAGKQVRLMIIGKKGYDLFKWQYSHYIDNYFDFPKYHNNNLAFQVKDKLMEMVVSSKISNCQIYFNKCKNAMTQIATKQQILPIEKQISSNEQHLSYEYEGEGLILNMINLYVTAQINYALLQSRVSEEGARMTAMDNATKNANELINKLTLTLNRSRQDLITRDLIEIIAGAEAI